MIKLIFWNESIRNTYSQNILI